MYRSQTSNKIFSLFWILFVISLLFSTAGISIFLWSIFFVFLFELFKDTQQKGIQTTLSQFRTGLEIPLFGFVILCLISTYISSGFTKIFFETVWEMRFIVGFYTLAYMLKKYFEHLHKHTYQALFFTVCFCGIYGLAQMLYQIDLVRSTHDHLSPSGDFFRATGFFKIPLTYAYVISMLGMFFYSFTLVSIKKNNRLFILSSIGFALAFMGTVSSWTRGAWVAIAIATLIMTLVYNKKMFIKITALFIFVTSLLLLNSTFRERFLSIANTTDYASNTDRIDVWKANLAMIADHPMLGVGWEQNEKQSILKAYYQKIGKPNGIIFDHAHNDYINIASMAGLPAFGLYLWFCFGFLIQNIRKLQKSHSDSQKAILLGCLGAQIIFYIGGITQVNFTDMEVNHTLLTVWAIQESQTSDENI